jgi:peptidoglycan/LPS O-acetylase OafA/YrhL
MNNLSNYWQAQTAIFAIIFAIAVFVSLRKKSECGAMPKEASNELRGLAILGVIFAHLTYGKFYGTGFLFPLGIWSGIVVNLFFFLSGFGLAASSIYHPKPIRDFYLKRVGKIYLPLWLTLTVLLIADAALLHRFYPTREIIFSFLGFFPKANLFDSLNSPLWFLTPLLFYYLVFPWLFKADHPRRSAVLVFVASGLLLWTGWPVSSQIHEFYQTHWLAFPLGVLFAVLVVSPRTICASCGRKLRCHLYCWLRFIRSKIFGRDIRIKPLARIIIKLKSSPAFWRWPAVIILAFLAWQTAYHSGVGRGVCIEHAYALFTMICLISLSIFKKTKFALLEIIGVYSFEIYLIHWPLVSRYDVFYEILPPWLATLAFLSAVMILAVLFNRLWRLLGQTVFGRKSIRP